MKLQSTTTPGKFNPRALFAAAAIATASPAFAATVTKSAGGADLTLGTGWTGGAAPTSADVATWDSGSLGAGLTVGSNVAWGSIDITGASSNIGITGAGITTGNISLTGSQTLTIGNAIALSGNSIYTIADVTGDANADATLSGVISGSGFGITKAGAGTLTLSGLNTYTGNTAINAGTLVFKTPANANWTLNGGTKTIASGATMRVDMSAQTTQFRTTIIGTVTIGGTLELSGTATNINGFYVVNGTNALTASGAGNLNIAGGGAIVINSTAALDNFTGTVNITGTSQLSLQGGSTSTVGNFAVNIAPDAKLDMRTDNMKIGTLTGSGTIIKSYLPIASALSIGNDGGSGTYAGNITAATAALSLTKAGSGTQTLTGDNRHAGGTTITGGTLNAANNTAGQYALGTGAVTINGGTLAINDASAGQLTLGTGASLAMSSGSIAIDVTGLSAYDKIIGTGGTGHFTLTHGTLLLNGFAGFEGSGGSGNSYNLFGNFAGTGNNTTGLTISGYDTAGWLASLNASTGTLSFTAVPEPSTYGLLGAGALAAALARRRRKLAGRVA